MNYKELWVELLTNLEKKEYELRLLANDESRSTTDRERLQIKISGLVLAIEDMYNLQQLAKQ